MLTLHKMPILGSLMAAAAVAMMAPLGNRATGAAADGPQLAHMVYFKLKDNSGGARAKLVAACKLYLTGHDGTVSFATNVLQIATAPGNPKGITSFADLAKPDLKVVVCAPQVPCGAAADKIEKATGVRLKPVSEEADVKSTLGKVTSGDADAGLVYVTDVAAAKGQMQGVRFPEAKQATTNYPIAVLKNASQAELAQQFEDLVTGEAGQKELQAAGFGPGT